MINNTWKTASDRVTHAKRRWCAAAIAIAALLAPSFPVYAGMPVLRSSVSPEFPDGLHSKYLRYIAERLEVRLDLYPMPFARRIKALKQGDIDIMVGLKHSYSEQGFVYLFPAYEALRNTFFVHKNEAHELTEAADISALILGATLDNPGSQLALGDRYKALVRVSSLEQKIRLLARGRIDAFAHFESSAQLMIERLGLTEELIVAPYQPDTVRNYFVGLSTASEFFSQRGKLEAILREGVINGDFAAIRLAHENSMTDDPQEPANKQRDQ